MRIFLFALIIGIGLFAGPAVAQTASCTTLTVGQTQDITAFSVCRRVTLSSVPQGDAVSICVPTNTTAAEWQSFYDNPPAGVNIASCASGCTGFEYAGYCYYFGDSTVTCDTTCASYGGCNTAGTAYIGSDDTSAARCSAVITGATGVSTTAIGDATAGAASGCQFFSLKGGINGYNYYASPTTCAAAPSIGSRMCACNNGSSGGQACLTPWGGVVLHGNSVTAYQSSYGCTSCASETRTCNDGVLSGSYTRSGCQVLNGWVDPGGYCWLLSSSGASCDGLTGCGITGIGSPVVCDEARTRDFAGSGGSNANCQSVLSGLGAAGSTVSTLSSAIGCSVTSSTRRRGTTSTTCAATASGYIRACACTWTGY